MDRRIKRTRTAVFNAVLDLMIEKDTSKITVLELCKKADINKSTFYLHYKSMDDCIQRCFQAIMNGVVDISKKIKYDEIKSNPKPAVDRLLDEVERNIDYLKRLRDSKIYGSVSKVFKDNLIKSIIESNGFTIEKNYFEITTTTFAVAGCFDAVISALPVFDKEELSKAICTMLKARTSNGITVNI